MSKCSVRNIWRPKFYVKCKNYFTLWLFFTLGSSYFFIGPSSFVFLVPSFSLFSLNLTRLLKPFLSYNSPSLVSLQKFFYILLLHVILWFFFILLLQIISFCTIFYFSFYLLFPFASCFLPCLVVPLLVTSTIPEVFFVFVTSFRSIYHLQLFPISPPSL